MDDGVVADETLKAWTTQKPFFMSTNFRSIFVDL